MGEVSEDECRLRLGDALDGYDLGAGRALHFSRLRAKRSSMYDGGWPYCLRVEEERHRRDDARSGDSNRQRDVQQTESVCDRRYRSKAVDGALARGRPLIF